MESPANSTIGPRPSSELGYASRLYGESLHEFGELCELPSCGGWLLTNPIAKSSFLDARGGYPLFLCNDWSALADDLARLSNRFVTVRLVTDPFAPVTATQLAAAFPDVCYQYKEHYVTELAGPLELSITGDHRRKARRAAERLDVRQCSPGDDFLNVWNALYDHLINRHQITGIAQFSSDSFRLQMSVPGFSAFMAADAHGPCAATWWYIQRDVAYYHLGASNARGYEANASYALFWTALSHFASLGIGWAVLGAGAGTHSTESGLTRFKRGWATETRPAFFGGRILQPQVYRRLTATTSPAANFFPAYRAA